jgi:hypothetical protein
MSSLLTAAQIAYYAQLAGFTGQDLITAVAIALAESSGNPNAYNPETAAGTPQGEGSEGLWQIYLNANPQYIGANLYDPQTNASAAYSLYSAAGGFSPWATYNSGAYQAYLGAAGAAAPLAIPAALAPVSLSMPTGISWETILLGLGILAGISLVLEEV